MFFTLALVEMVTYAVNVLSGHPTLQKVELNMWLQGKQLKEESHQGEQRRLFAWGQEHENQGNKNI